MNFAKIERGFQVLCFFKAIQYSNQKIDTNVLTGPRLMYNITRSPIKFAGSYNKLQPDTPQPWRTTLTHNYDAQLWRTIMTHNNSATQVLRLKMGNKSLYL